MNERFKLAIDDVIDVPVTLNIASGSRTKNFFFHIEMRRMDADEARRRVGPEAENQNERIDDLICDVSSGWRGQRLVLDGNEPADFSEEALRQMLTVSGASMVIYMAYVSTLVASSGDAGRRKNSGS